MKSLEDAGWNPFNLVRDARSPIFATLGRVNLRGAYLAILAPLTLALLLAARQRRSPPVLLILSYEKTP